MTLSLPRFVVLWAGLAVACTGGGAPASSPSAPPVDIFLGKIKKWNDPALAKENPGVKLPTTDITVAHRSDGSGTDFMKWALTDGQKYAPELGYAPRPGKVVALELEALKKIG
jgi:ABC-type phosphate transport system substrate-binding protein